MLYDPKWQVETKADPLTLENLIAWLEKQPKNMSYNYGCNGHCLLAQYFGAFGFIKVGVGSSSFSHDVDGTRICGIRLPPHFNAVAYYGRHTFGAALDRARRALARC